MTKTYANGLLGAVLMTMVCSLGAIARVDEINSDPSIASPSVEQPQASTQAGNETQLTTSNTHATDQTCGAPGKDGRDGADGVDGNGGKGGKGGKGGAAGNCSN